MFAALTFDREPLSMGWGSLNSWVQTVGGFAAAALVMWLIVYAASRRNQGTGTFLGSAGAIGFIWFLLGPLGVLVYLVAARRGGPQMNLAAPGPGGTRGVVTRALFLAGALWALMGYTVLAVLYIPELLSSLNSEGGGTVRAVGGRLLAQDIAWTVAGAAALFAVLVPILADLTLFSPRRIMALAGLSFKEAVRRKILWVFLSLLLLVLFGSWFIPHKYEDQVRTYVSVIFLARAGLLILAILLLASFGIPDDIRHQTIHTVLTKPVQRFEIFLGRFLGYAALMTLVLVVISALGLVYVLRGVDQEAADESLKARVPLYGALHFEGTKEREKGENVGREWEYRSYIFGPQANQPTQYAVWEFRDLPSDLAGRDKIRLEFTLDIYRTTKYGENVLCSFLFESWRWDANNPAQRTKYDERRKELTASLQTDRDAQAKFRDDPQYVEKKLAEEFGYFETRAFEVKDYHTQYVEFPAAVLANALNGDQAPRKEMDKRKGAEGPAAPFRILVRCDSRTQFLGMAKYDLYLRRDNPNSGSDSAMFCLNFAKGSFGVWLLLCLVIGLAVALSTYLSGVITLLTTGILFVLGFFQEFIQDVAFGRVVGGGPTEAVMRLLRRPGGESLATPLEDSAQTRVATGLDGMFSWLLRRVMDIIPDIDRFSFTDFVAEGVSISGGQMVFSFLLLVGYLLPWAVLAYYLLRWREVASST